MNLLEIKDLTVNVLDKEIIKEFNLMIKSGEIHVLMGKNGSGKSTLVNTIMGHENYQIKKGEIKFTDQLINDQAVDLRAKLGIYLCLQNPPVIEGLSTAELLRNVVSRDKDFKLFSFVQDLTKSGEKVNISEEMLHRSINDGFSGGERKRNEILQLLMLKPKLLLLDEIDSGVDVDSLKNITDIINQYKSENPEVSILIITHHSNILKYLNPDYVHIMDNGKIIKTGDLSLVHEIEKSGFDKTIKCAVKEWVNHE